MKTAVIAEKPSVGRDIAKVLDCRNKGTGFFEGSQFVVTWALGHLVTLAEPEDYDPKYKTWDINHLPIMPDELQLVVIPQTSKQYKTVKDILLRKDVSSVVIATDAGREGELVARWIIEKANCKKPIRRLWISSVTDKAIRDGFQNLKDGKLYLDLCDSSKARAEADWLVGINATRCLTTKFNGQLSCGRVQTPTVAIVAKREEEIRKFVPQKFYGLSALAKAGAGASLAGVGAGHGGAAGSGASSGGAAGLGAGAGGAAGASAAANAFRLTWVDGKSGVARCFDKAKIDGILAELESPKVKKEGVVTDITKSIKKKNPPKLYDLTELQRDANKRYGYSPKDTLSIMQSLYEEHKLLTYPRTDSRYISTDIIPTIPERLKACSDKPYAKMCAHILRSPIRPNSNYVDNAKVSDHHAIIPTEQPLSLILLSERERKIYDLVVTRFLSVFYPPFEYEQTKVTLKIGNETFTANGKVVISQGYKGVYQGADSDDEDEDDDGGWGGGFGGGSGSGGSFGGGFGGGGNSSGGSSGGGSGWSGSSGGVGGGVSSGAQTLPKLKKGDRLPIQSIKITEGTTSPPAPFNEATLLSAMESPAKYMTTQDTSLARTLEQTGGLGTVATRADIIEKLFDSFLIEKKGKDIFSTSKGRQLLNLVPKDLKSPELTGEWEQKLLSISKGNLNKSIFLSGIRSYTAEIIREIKNSTETYRHDNLTTNKCPNCGKFMLQVKGKKGDMLVCQDRECNARVNISISIRSKCPNCNKFMKITGEGDGRRVVCTCGYREKYSSFEKRKKEERNSLSKREVQDYIEKLNKRDEKGKKDDKDNPFAALKDLKF